MEIKACLVLRYETSCIRGRDQFHSLGIHDRPSEVVEVQGGLIIHRQQTLLIAKERKHAKRFVAMLRFLPLSLVLGKMTFNGFS